MAEILTQKTERSPLVSYDGQQLIIEGRSFMDNAVDFYRGLIAHINGLDFHSLDVKVKLDYFNTSSSKCLLEIFRNFERISADGRTVQIFWFYDPNNPDLEEAGEDYRDLIDGIEFELVPLS